MASDHTISRRHFLVAGASGLTLGVALQSVPGLSALPGLNRVAAAAPALSGPTVATLNAYIKVGTDNKVTVMYGGSELGQGTKTALAQVAAEELHVTWASVSVVQADADPSISYVTFGSSAVMTQFLPLATVGA